MGSTVGPKRELGEHDVHPQAWKMPLQVLASVAFVLVGVWMLLAVDDVLMKIVGLSSVAFFGLTAVMGASRLIAARRGGGVAVRIRPDGLEVPVLGTAGGIGLLPWDDIASFGVIVIGGVAVTAIRLLKYDRFLASIGDEDAASTLALYRRLQKGARFARYPVAALELSQLQDPSDILRTLGRVGPASDLASILAQSRKAYGAEILLPWQMRDRSATEFAMYLETCQQQAIAAAALDAT